MYFEKQEAIKHKTEAGVEFPDGTCTLYNGTGGAISQGEVFQVKLVNTADQRWQPEAPATGTERMLVVAEEDIADGSIGYFRFAGQGKAIIDGNSNNVSAGDVLEVLNTSKNFIKAGTAVTSEGKAIALEAVTADNVLADVLLHGGQVEVKGS